MKPEETVDYHIKFAWHQINKMYNNSAAKYEGTAAIGFLLLNINKENGTPATQIAPKMGMEPKSIGRILNELERRKLIARVPDEKDKRINRIVLTASGLAMRDVAAETVKEFNQRVQTLLTKDELKVFYKCMNTILKIAKNNE
jgi:DNA-binding MarR family transcriptional regulator